MRAIPVLAGLAAAGLAVAAWQGARRQRLRHDPPPRNVLLVTVDTLRGDALGKPDGETPWMDRLSAAGLRFDAAHAHNVLTLPSHANILSGRYPFDHGVRDNAGFRFPAGVETVATLLKARGFRTGAFVSAFPLDSRFGLSRGFDVYDDDFVGAEAAPAFVLQERSGVETVARARAWMEADGAHPTFTWVHVFEPHFPYEPPEPWATRFRGREYRGEVAATDALLRPLLEPILAQGDGRTLVVLTADHGESLGEHGEATHGIFAYEATLKVPLVVYLPSRARPGTSRTTARHVDVLPTILDAVGAPPIQGLPGRSLIGGAPGSPEPPVATYFEALSGALNRGWAPLTGVLRGNEKYIDLPVAELYDLAADPAETRNLSGSRPQDVAAARSVLAGFGAGAGEAGRGRETETAETVERLRSLGYTAGRGSTTAKELHTAADDPKSLIAVDADLEAIVRDYQQGDRTRALARSRDLVRRHPGMPIALLQLAHLERESGNLEAGIDALRRVLAEDPANQTALALAGAYLTQAGRAAEAARLLEPHARGPLPDFDVLTARALALARSGAREEALATLARAREADPTNVMGLVHEGTVHLMGNDRERARAAFAEAVARHPGVARAHSSLGMMAAEDGRLDEARAHWTEAVRLDAREAGKLLALASLLGGRKRESEARAYLELFVATAPADVYGREIEGVRRFLGNGGAGSRR